MNRLELLVSELNDKGLPGQKAQLKMAPKVRIPELMKQGDAENAQKSAVLILLFEEHDKIKTVLIKRQEYNGVHSGQISFPGGRKETGDRDLVETAIREANEEIGVECKDINILFPLSTLFIPPSNFLVLPVLAYTNRQAVFIPQPDEVQYTIKTDLADFFETSRVKLKEFQSSSRPTRIFSPCYEIGGHIIWGATAMIISELLEVIKQVKSYQKYL